MLSLIPVPVTLVVVSFQYSVEFPLTSDCQIVACCCWTLSGFLWPLDRHIALCLSLVSYGALVIFRAQCMNPTCPPKLPEHPLDVCVSPCVINTHLSCVSLFALILFLCSMNRFMSRQMYNIYSFTLFSCLIVQLATGESVQWWAVWVEKMRPKWLNKSGYCL